VTGGPGLSSSRSDAGLVTCQVHQRATRRRPHRPALRWHSTGPPHRSRPPGLLVSPTHPL